ncbi:coiled-coil-helix-coiled-coil-helix domain-containing protein [Aspergillus clavatus NRRL 1]|uniref:CHCH domain protein n=1 Tax=Aspergillus clavatus (strain ATCC 1007 / CBS 513.65 / DSM 816 / NCTC 3887 / NRRL 1 / QM 1276 / 107) TaxID=344612 RepID=A1CJA5_ASPCL|nr:CHCH domain protein [Aspergillus clavatus NRRL 1]EAW09229.1 CHCH domain protein [Aspergillus clavatus NRRL 1]
MPRQRRGAAPAPTPARSAPTRPTVAPARPAAAPHAQQHQPHSTAAHPPAQQAPPPMAPVQQSSGPGLFGQMASTAAGVAVGSSIGHAIGGFFSGGSSSAPAETQQAAPAQAQPMDSALWQGSATNSSWENPACETDVRNFRKCMDENQGNMTICGWYLDQLKACQAAAKQY